jgi:hypothetical protein
VRLRAPERRRALSWLGDEIVEATVERAPRARGVGRPHRIRSFVMSSAVELYLLQLKSLLPAKLRDDVAAEIRGSIDTVVAERERELGRELDDDEANDVLRGYGSPLAVAGRYLPMQYLIGPRAFPLYWYVMRALLVVIASIAGVVAAIALFTNLNATRSVAQVLVRFFWIAIEAGGIVTLLFAVLERSQLAVLDDYDPRRFGRGVLGNLVERLGEIPRNETLLHLVSTAILLLWWTGWISFPTVIADVEVELGSAARALFVPVAALCLFDLARLATDLLLPYYTRPRAWLSAVAHVAWIVVLALAISAPDLLQAAPSVEDPAEIERVVRIAQHVFQAAILGVGVWTAALLVRDVRRLARRA